MPGQPGLPGVNPPPQSTGGTPGGQAPASDAASGRTPELPAAPSWEQTKAAQKTIAELQDQRQNLTPEQAAQLDAAERTVASAIEANLLRKQAVLAQRGEQLSPREQADLAAAQARLARPENGPTAPGDKTTSKGTDGETGEDRPPSIRDGTDPAKPALFDDVPRSQKTEEQRKADNDYLRAHMPPRRQAASKSMMVNKLAGVHGLAMEKAGLLMDSVHDGVGIGKVQVGFNPPENLKAAGNTRCTAPGTQ